MHYVGTDVSLVRVLDTAARWYSWEGGVFVFNRADVDPGHRERRLSQSASIAVIGFTSAILWAILVFILIEIWSML